MYTQFTSVDEFFKAVRSETRHYRHVEDKMLRGPVEEYQLWEDDSSPDKQPFEVELRQMLENSAKLCRRPSPAKPPAYWERVEPAAAQKQLFDLFGIDWQSEAIAELSKSA